ncbi:MAG: 3'(2'),5'-bisphosphate nucleotidase CysQ, partial [Gammaproteobacteria bacterium]
LDRLPALLARLEPGTLEDPSLQQKARRSRTGPTLKLKPNDLQTLCAYAIKAARSTGDYIANTRPINVEHKDNGGSLATQIVTEVDRESQRRIVETLAPSMAHFDLGLLTEESPDDGSRLSKDYFWCIDPIDGTLCFVEGTPGYAVSIALISRDGQPVIGVVYDPVERRLYHAMRGGGAFRHGAPWSPDLNVAEKPLTIFTDHSEAQRARFEPTARALQANWGAYGGGVMNAIRCLENGPACYFKFAKTEPGGGCFWDFAATTCIYREVNAWASDVSGSLIDFNHPKSVSVGHCGILFATDARVAQRFLNAAP